MCARPITGWAYTPRGSTHPWLALDPAFGRDAVSEPTVARRLDAAAHRWGRSRIGCLTASGDWPTDDTCLGRGLAYAKLGLRSGAEVVRSAWMLLEEDVVDAVLVRAEFVELLLERAGSSALQLRVGGEDCIDLVLRPCWADCLSALVVACAAIEGGIACGEGGVEPDRVHVQMPEHAWTVEVRP